MKNKIRREILALRNAMPKTLIEEYSEIISQKIIRHQAYENAEFIFCYVDAKNEVKTSKIIEDAWSKGKKVAVPRVHGDTMEFYLIEKYDDLELGNFSILEPKESCELVRVVPKGSLVIMPGVAFDKEGNRIGYGRGYYDKYFTKYPEIYKIALAFALQIVPEIPAESHDLKADCVITEESEMEEIIMNKEFNAEEIVDAFMEEEYEEMEEMDEAEIITLTMEDGTEVPCLVLTIVEVEGQDYIALLPIDEVMTEGNEGDGFIFRYSEDEEGMPVLEGIEDDEEFERVSAVLDEVMEITVEEEE